MIIKYVHLYTCVSVCDANNLDLLKKTWRFQKPTVCLLNLNKIKLNPQWNMFLKRNRVAVFRFLSIHLYGNLTRKNHRQNKHILK